MSDKHGSSATVILRLLIQSLEKNNEIRGALQQLIPSIHDPQIKAELQNFCEALSEHGKNLSKQIEPLKID